MSRRIALSHFTQKQLDQISDELEIDTAPIKKKKGKFGYGNQQPKYMYPYELVEENGEDHLYLPFAYASKYKVPRPKKSNFDTIDVEFVQKLRPEQRVVKREAVNSLSRTGSIVISAYTGFGKTASAIYLTVTKLKLKTLVVVNRVLLMKQWKKSFEFFTPGVKVQIVEPKKKPVDPDADVYIMNAINVEKMGRQVFSKVGTMIVDELHLIMSEVLSRCMNIINPRFVIGLSATPYRPDGMNKLIELYFGKKQIHRKLERHHLVYEVNTTFEPEMEKGATGRLDWNKCLTSQCMNEGRNEMIIRIVKQFPERVFLILTKRKDQGYYLVNRLKEEGENVTSLIGTQQEFEKSARILVGIVQKAGTGFDHKRLNTLIVASDLVEYFIQYLGRVFRVQEGTPWVFDIVDKNYVMKKHYKTRQEVYLDAKGEIRNFRREFPDFQVI